MTRFPCSPLSALPLASLFLSLSVLRLAPRAQLTAASSLLVVFAGWKQVNVATLHLH